MSDRNDKDNTVEYLQIIQEPINRMSTISAIIKGFTITIVSVLLTLSYECKSAKVFLLCSFPIIVFALLDVYYLAIERKYRYLYEQVRQHKHKCDFSLNLIDKKNKKEMEIAKARVFDCLISPSIWVFYVSALVFLWLLISWRI